VPIPKSSGTESAVVAQPGVLLILVLHGNFRISIGDVGPGVPESQLDNIFKPFSRRDGQSAAGGYGLGLAIARRAIAAVDGKIQAKDKVGGGLLVEIDLPV